MEIFQNSLKVSLRGAIGLRVRLLTERLVVQAHPGTILSVLIIVFYIVSVKTPSC